MHQQSSEQTDKYHSKISAILIERAINYKQKEETAKQAVRFWGIFIFVTAAIFLFFSWYNHPSMDINLTSLLQSIRNTISIIALSLIIIGIAKLNSAKKSYEKAEDEFKQLREEIIDRQEQLWDTAERWENRSELFSQIDKQYGINLFHK